jgi:hypothetical protein
MSGVAGRQVHDPESLPSCVAFRSVPRRRAHYSRPVVNSHQAFPANPAGGTLKGLRRGESSCKIKGSSRSNTFPSDWQPVSTGLTDIQPHQPRR